MISLLTLKVIYENTSIVFLCFDRFNADIGGLDNIIEQLREAIIFPLVYPRLFQSAAGLYAAPKGVLLYGPPGCGKTLLAKALAKESGATFINTKVSSPIYSE